MKMIALLIFTFFYGCSTAFAETVYMYYPYKDDISTKTEAELLLDSDYQKFLNSHLRYFLELHTLHGNAGGPCRTVAQIEGDPREFCLSIPLKQK
ncbi:hypothetical protein GW846_00895 [Candidatus Gracilibacteria bacterium]|nr:hypothetical protein [Candidatus Gracilibacteria bacterium]